MIRTHRAKPLNVGWQKTIPFDDHVDCFLVRRDPCTIPRAAANRLRTRSRLLAADSSGLGELVGLHTTLRKAGGQMKLFNLSKRLEDMLQLTNLTVVFDQENEASASRPF